MRIIAVGSALALASFGAVGLLLADLGFYSGLLALVLGGAGFAGLCRLARPVLQSGGDGEVSRTSRICAAAAGVLSAVMALWNASNASQHAQINRDGGLYLNAGKWIAAHGTLYLHPMVGPFAHTPGLIATSTGMKQRGYHLEFDLSHMLSAILAEAQNLGGNRFMYLTVPLLGGVALLAFYLLAARLLRQPVAALGATATLALLMPQISFSRDSTTEIPIQVLLFSALWVLCDRRTLRTSGLAFSAGLLLGLVQAMHVDGLAFLVGLPAVYAITWLHTNRSGRRQLKRGILWSGAGVITGLLFGAIDLFMWDHYYLSVVRKNVVKLAAVEILAIAAAIAVVLLVRRRRDLVDSFQRARSRWANAAGALVLIAAFGAWFVRPRILHAKAGPNDMVQFVQRLNHLAIDPTKRYAEYSVQWISWYLGPITLTIGIIGAAALAIALVRGSVQLPVQVATLMFAPPALLYVWRPTITPDHVWAARRFLPAVFPALILLTFAVLCALVRGAKPNLAGGARSLAIVLGIAAIVYPWFTVRDVSQMTEQRGLLPVIATTCKALGPHGAVVMVEEKKSVAWLSDPQTLRAYCDVPVAIMPDPLKARVLHTLADEWRARGRTLYVVTGLPETITQLFPHAHIKARSLRKNFHFLEQTLTRRPGKYRTEILQLFTAPVPRTKNAG